VRPTAPLTRGDEQEQEAEDELEPIHPRRGPAVARLAGPAIASRIAPAIAMPAIQPSRNAGPLVRARRVTSISTTATIGIGLTATPTANGSSCPMASPIPTRLLLDGRRRYGPPG